MSESVSQAFSQSVSQLVIRSTVAEYSTEMFASINLLVMPVYVS